jgi:plasmid segregation protein ParM
VNFTHISFEIFIKVIIMSNIIAVDIGFGSTKVMTSQSIFKFPSAIARVKEAQGDLVIQNAFDFRGKNYFVGDDALREAITTRGYSFLQTYAPLLLYKAFIDASINITSGVKLATGLSLLHWKDREEFANLLTDVVVDKNRVKSQVQLIPQGKGIYVDFISKNPQYENKLVMVVDIGYNTLDVIPFENGKPLVGDAWATSQGVNIIINELRKKLAKELSISFSEARINECMIKKFIQIENEEHDISFFVNEEKENYNELVTQELQSHNYELYKSASAIIISGGGAYHFGELKAKSMVYTEVPHELSNVRGYYKLLKQE